MDQVTLLEFRRNADGVLRRIRSGHSLVLTKRGRPVARLEPIRDPEPDAEDPIYRLASLARRGGRSMTNRDVDRAIYGI